jgi:hypothetical protein
MSLNDLDTLALIHTGFDSFNALCSHSWKNGVSPAVPFYIRPTLEQLEHNREIEELAWYYNYQLAQWGSELVLRICPMKR